MLQWISQWVSQLAYITLDFTMYVSCVWMVCCLEACLVTEARQRLNMLEAEVQDLRDQLQEQQLRHQVETLTQQLQAQPPHIATAPWRQQVTMDSLGLQPLPRPPTFPPQEHLFNPMPILHQSSIQTPLFQQVPQQMPQHMPPQMNPQMSSPPMVNFWPQQVGPIPDGMTPPGHINITPQPQAPCTKAPPAQHTDATAGTTAAVVAAAAPPVDDAQSWDVTEPINKKPRFSGNQQWQPSAWKAHVRKEPRRCFYCWENSYVGYQKCTNKDCPLNTNNWDWWKGDGQEHSVSASTEAAAGSDSAGGA